MMCMIDGLRGICSVPTRTLSDMFFDPSEINSIARRFGIPAPSVKAIVGPTVSFVLAGLKRITTNEDFDATTIDLLVTALLDSGDQIVGRRGPQWYFLQADPTQGARVFAMLTGTQALEIAAANIVRKIEGDAPIERSVADQIIGLIIPATLARTSELARSYDTRVNSGSTEADPAVIEGLGSLDEVVAALRFSGAARIRDVNHD